MKRFCCGDVVPGCDATFVGNHDEILAAVAGHACEQHGLETIPSALVRDVETLMVRA